MACCGWGGPGEIAGLAAFLEEHCEAVEADLQRWYGIDLRDLWRGRMSYRRLWVLLNRLPQESWTQTILRDRTPDDALVAPARDEQRFGPWALDNYQLASVLDAIRHLEFTLARVNGNEWPPPDPTPRPGVQRRGKPSLSPRGVTYLNSLRAKGA